MQVPPVQFDLSTSKTEPPLSRLPWVWVLAALVFGVMIFGSLTINDKKGSHVKSSSKTRDRALELQMRMKSMMPESSRSARNVHAFDQQIDDLLADAKKDPSAQKLRIVLRREDSQEPFKDDIKNLSESKLPENQAFAKLYSNPTPKKEEAMNLLKQINGDEISERIAIVQIKEALGDKSIRSKTFDPSSAVAPMVFVLLGLIGFGLGTILWFVYYGQRQAGNWVPKGLPMANIDMERADRLLFVSLIIIITFAASSFLAAKFLPSNLKGIQIFEFLPIFVVIAICLSVPIFGWRITPKSIGLSFEKMPEKIGWAVGTFFANIPILLVFIMITAILSRFLPGGSHPVSEELLKDPKPMQIAKLAFLACVIAPIWEEIFFRGLLFPAFTKGLGKPIYGAVVSSFIFASIHPQGLLGVPVLMGIALMLCALSYQTKSLVSNIILHGLHNGATLAAALILAPMFG